ncbi:MAG: hypothetical protein WDO16_23740 [Bacteroidota bacterium]
MAFILLSLSSLVNPGETKEDISKTIRMINKLLPYEIGISVSYPLPGTVFF